MLKQELQKLVAFKANRKRRTSSGQENFERISEILKKEAEDGSVFCHIEVCFHTNQNLKVGPVSLTNLNDYSLELYDRLTNEGLSVEPHIIRDMIDSDIDSDDYILIFTVRWE